MKYTDKEIQELESKVQAGDLHALALLKWGLDEEGERKADNLTFSRIFGEFWQFATIKQRSTFQNMVTAHRAIYEEIPAFEAVFEEWKEVKNTCFGLLQKYELIERMINKILKVTASNKEVREKILQELDEEIKLIGYIENGETLILDFDAKGIQTITYWLKALKNRTQALTNTIKGVKDFAKKWELVEVLPDLYKSGEAIFRKEYNELRKHRFIAIVKELHEENKQLFDFPALSHYTDKETLKDFLKNRLIKRFNDINNL